MGRKKEEEDLHHAEDHTSSLDGEPKHCMLKFLAASKIVFGTL